MSMTSALFWAGMVIGSIGFGMALVAFYLQNHVVAITGIVMMIAGLFAIIASAPYVQLR